MSEISKLAGETAVERKERRQRYSAPVVAEVRAFLDEQRALVPPKTPLGKALGYLHRQLKRLTLFLDDGNIELTNNRRERELRKLVQGRKSWLFTWQDVGGERTASILTILATCASFELNPRAYLHVVTKHILYGCAEGTAARTPPRSDRPAPPRARRRPARGSRIAPRR